MVAAAQARARCLPRRPVPHASTTPAHPHPHTQPQVISLAHGSKGEVSYKIMVLGSASAAEVVVPDVQAGCPAVVHVIDAVLLPALDSPAAAAGAEAGAAAAPKHSMLGWADLLGMQA